MNNNQIPLLAINDIFALLENRKADNNAYLSHLFWEPIEILTYNSNENIENYFNKILKHQKNGNFLVAYFKYELGYCFEQKLKDFLKPESSLSVVVAFKKHLKVNQSQINTLLSTLIKNLPDEELPCLIYGFQFSTEKKQYLEAVNKIKKYIKSGDIYQTNYTIGLNFNFQGHPLQLYNLLRDRQKVEYSVFFNLNEQKILSLSPELFFRKQSNFLQSKPMKGTCPRGLSADEDISLINFMKNDTKTLAENVMIVDLLRNDIGRIAKSGTVNVSKLFEIEEYETVFQMTSTIEGEVSQSFPIGEILKHIFPCGSVTGAPKIRAMEIIHELEAESRDIYTGSIGYILPNNDICMNVPIRTVILNDQGSGKLGIGSGIVFDSEPEKEYEEVILKSKFLTEIEQNFELIETFYYSSLTGYRFLSKHLKRLEQSSKFFSFKNPIDCIHQDLIKLIEKMATNTHYKVRLLLNKKGQYFLSFDKIDEDSSLNKKIMVSSSRISSKNILFQHKTTHTSTRQFYELEYLQARNKFSCYEVIFTNERGEITEGTRTNIFIEKNNITYTPPLTCGLLNGIQRNFLLNNKEYPIIEKVIYENDLHEADKIYLTNSVRGIIEVSID